MFRIDDATAASSLPVPETAGTEGYFTEGDPVAGTPATNVRGSWLNMIQEELRAIVVAGGLTPSKTTYNQVLTALNAQFAALSQFPAVFAASGYLKIPVVVAGVKKTLIMQWGGTGASSSGGAVTVAFPISFPNQCFGVVLGATTVTGSVFPAVDNSGLTLSSFPYSTWTSSTGVRAGGLGSTYIAIGW